MTERRTKLIPFPGPVKILIKGEAPNRKLVTDNDISAGSYFLYEDSSPFNYCLNVDEWKKRCQFCLCGSDELRRCSGCKCVYYCDQTCQRQHWQVHQTECVFLEKFLVRSFDNADVLRDCLMLARVCRLDEFKVQMNHLCRGKLTPASYKE